MLNFIKSTAVAAMIGISGIAALPAQAAADGVHLGFGRDGVVVQVQQRDFRHRPDPRGCSAGEALRKAERMGLRRAHVSNQNRNVIRVSGRVRGGRDTITFANARGCPVIRR
jgi:hypothetical protein